MLMILFLPRDALHSADYAVERCLTVRLCVCPSVTRRYSVETAKDIIELFTLSDSDTILVFPYQTV